jgi:AcrR family transcriptional regulator
MAEGRGRRAGRRAAQAVVSDTDRIIDAALTLTVAQGWRNVSLAAVANEANLPILQVYRIFSSKSAILCGLSRRIDAAVLAAPIEAETGERPRDRVFDLLMRRFDALRPHRDALAALRRDLPFDPLSAVAAGAALLCSMRLMLEAAGIACSGIGGVISVKLVAATGPRADDGGARPPAARDRAVFGAAPRRGKSPRGRSLTLWLTSPWGFA